MVYGLVGVREINYRCGVRTTPVTSWSHCVQIRRYAWPFFQPVSCFYACFFFHFSITCMCVIVSWWSKNKRKRLFYIGGETWFSGLRLDFGQWTLTKLTGDNIRFGLNKDLAFSEEDRKENIRRIAEVQS